jgi:Replication initiation factor
LDLTIDDYEKRFRPIDAYQVYKSGGVTGFRQSGQYHERDMKGDYAQTFSLGRRGKQGSGKYLIIYDKWLESLGERDCVRIELSLYGHQYAHQAFSNFVMGGVDLWSELIPAYIIGAVNFLDVDPGSEARADRCERVSWWDSIVQDRCAMKLSGKVIIKTLDKAVKWFKKQVAPTMALLMTVKCMQGQQEELWWEFFWDTIFDGEKRWSEHHLAMLNDIKGKLSLMH